MNPDTSYHQKVDWERSKKPSMKTEIHSEKLDQSIGSKCWHNGQVCCKSGRWV
jgi:hypothetical protein